MDFPVRLSKAADFSYLSECWLQNEHRATGEPIGRIKPRVRYILHGADVYVAHAEGDEDAILGFAVIDGNGRTMMAYTRATARRLGVQTAIFRKVDQ